MVDHLVNSEANKQRIARIESSFGSGGVPLQKSGRVLLGEGMLTKICKKKPKFRQFFLFNDILVYGNIVIGNSRFKQYNKQRIIPLEEIKLNNIEDDGTLRNGWFVCSRSKSFAVYASTVIEKQQWMDHIARAVQEYVRDGNVRVSNIYAAAMVPDSETKNCMHCGKTEFTFFNRRHHCRKCGLVVCGDCSTQTAVIPGQSDKPQRVCAACAVELKREREDRRDAGDNQDAARNGTASPTDDSDDDETYAGSDAYAQPTESASFYDRNSKGYGKPEDPGRAV